MADGMTLEIDNRVVATASVLRGLAIGAGKLIRETADQSELRSPARGERETGVSGRGQLPIVGVPDPIAIAKTCSAVIPLPTPALTVGRVTEATVLPACSGTDAK
jgi:hypothetical protein